MTKLTAAIRDSAKEPKRNVTFDHHNKNVIKHRTASVIDNYINQNNATCRYSMVWGKGYNNQNRAPVVENWKCGKRNTCLEVYKVMRIHNGVVHML